MDKVEMRRRYGVNKKLELSLRKRGLSLSIIVPGCSRVQHPATTLQTQGSSDAPLAPATMLINRMEFSVGERVLVAKQKATVLYVGPVDGHEGVWVGVEWDDPSRGKHDGSLNGKRYFTCSSGIPTAGSFIRINKVSKGNSLVDALVLRYTNQLAEGQANADGQVFLHTPGHRKVWVELVGEDKVTERQSKTELLHAARLVGANISHVGTPGSLSCIASNLVQLDLTDNLISNWNSVTTICMELPRLKVLLLSNNRLTLPETLGSISCAQQQLSGLQCLVLNQCGITWQQVGVLQCCLPNLQELHVAGNSISSLHINAKQLQQHNNSQQAEELQQQREGVAGLVGFNRLQVLGLEGNQIACWSEVLRLAGLPQLRRLHLSGNQISSIAIPQHHIPAAALFACDPPAFEEAGQQADQQLQQQQQPQPFAQLEALLLGNCCISQWHDVDQLNALPHLAELRLTGNPLFGTEGSAAGSGRRFEVIGRVAGLTLLNGADVKPRERRDCELRYLQSILADMQQAEGQQALQQQHPRLTELQTKYGQVSVAASHSSQQGSSLSSKTCELVLKHNSSNTKKKLPKTITVGALKLLSGRLFKLPPDQQQLILHMDSEQQLQQQPSEDISLDDTKTLGYWDVVDGCVIEVLHVDPEQQRAAEAASKTFKHMEQEQRMAQQLQQGDALRSAADR